MTIATCFQNFISKRKPNSTVSRLCSVLLHGRTVGGNIKPRQVFDRPGEVQVSSFSRDLYCFQRVLLTKESTIEASFFYDKESSNFPSRISLMFWNTIILITYHFHQQSIEIWSKNVGLKSQAYVSRKPSNRNLLLTFRQIYSQFLVRKRETLGTRFSTEQ